MTWLHYLTIAAWVAVAVACFVGYPVYKLAQLARRLRTRRLLRQHRLDVNRIEWGEL